MPDRVSKDGSRLVMTEYEVRTIDEYGDAVNVNHWHTLAEARAYADRCTAAAIVIEKHVSKYPARFYAEPDVYTTIETRGSMDALSAGGWA